MNAAAKPVEHAHFFQGDWRIVSVTRTTLICVLLMVAVLISAITVVQVKNAQRKSHHQWQTTQQQATQLQVEWRQLLLEHSTRVAPGRLQSSGSGNLVMILPDEVNTVVIL